MNGNWQTLVLYVLGMGPVWVLLTLYGEDTIPLPTWKKWLGVVIWPVLVPGAFLYALWDKVTEP